MHKVLFDEIFAEIISLWPVSIDVKKKKIFSDTAANIPNLIEVHDIVEDKIRCNSKFYNKDKDEYINWSDLIDWSIYTILHRQARVAVCDIIYPPSLSKDEVLNHCLENEEYASDWVK